MQEIRVIPAGGEFGQGGVEAGILGVALAAQEDHGADVIEGRVVVLRRVHEDLLRGSGAAGGVHDAVERDGQQRVFADAVAEIFGDVGGEEVARLVAVKPGRDGEALRPGRVKVQDTEGGFLKPVVGVLRSGGEDVEDLQHLLLRLARQVSTQVGGLHDAGATAAGDEETGLGQ